MVMVYESLERSLRCQLHVTTIVRIHPPTRFLPNDFDQKVLYVDTTAATPTQRAVATKNRCQIINPHTHPEAITTQRIVIALVATAVIIVTTRKK
jgi:hypothetical protein